MAWITDLIARVDRSDPDLAKELAAAVKTLSDRLEFGLNFERHIPESVELPGRRLRRGDKVRVLPERGTTGDAADPRLWFVTRIRNEKGVRTADLAEITIGPEREVATRDVDDLVVVAEFRDPIYPGLRSTGRLNEGGDKPFHTVINAENYHALEALLFAYEGKVDAIYIDPPYNTRDKDWKYNNDYVDPDDDYAHSKWLAFMERRLKLAKKLLNPARSSLIVTIDEKEYLRLGLLLEQTFREGRIQMVTSVISAKGAVRRGRFSRVEEYIFFVLFGDAQIQPWVRNMLNEKESHDEDGEAEEVEEVEEQTTVEVVRPIEWLGLRRREPSSVRGSRKNQFFPIFVHAENGSLHSIGDALDDDVDRSTVPVPDGTVALWPLKPSGAEMIWGLTPGALRKNWKAGFARVNNWDAEKGKGTVQYLPSGTISLIRGGDITVTGKGADGSVEGMRTAGVESSTPPKRVWHMQSHNAEVGGTKLLTALIPGRRFQYPKSLYAVEDALRFVVGDNQKALVVDFFAGSGTTAHSVMRLNRQDGGRRQSIMITNNEVSAEEATALRDQGHRPGDEAWEALGICEHVTKPRVTAAVTGRTAEGVLIEGRYRFIDAFPIAEGLEENVEFFDVTYEDVNDVRYAHAFRAVAPLLWLKAGGEGRRVDDPTPDYDIADTYGVLFSIDAAGPFIAEAAATHHLRCAFIVTDSEAQYQVVANELPEWIEPVRLYEAYLRSVEIGSGAD